MAATQTRALLALAVLGLLGAPTALGQPGAGCQQADTNMQCDELGSIAMPAQGTIDGSPVEVTAHITVTHNYQEQNARSFLFSVRNVSASDGTPSIATIQVTRFASAAGDIAVTRTEQPSSTEVDQWVDVLDVPVGQPIDLAVQAGATDKGAYRLEVLVQPFDKAYHTIKDSSGNDASLFSFTLLIVNKASGSGGGSNPLTNRVGGALHVPGMEGAAAAGSLALATVLAARRRTRAR